MRDASEEPASGDRLKPRSPQEVAQRVLAILVLIGKVHEPQHITKWMERNNIRPFLSPREADFIDDDAPSEQARVAASWRAEAAVSLVWALGGISEMPPLNEQFSIFNNEMVRSALKDPPAFIANARLRDAEELGAMEHHLYHQHWRVRDAELGFNVGKSLDPLPDDPPIEELDPGIVCERRYGLSWLVGWGADWDHVPTDT